jgi:response regulator RpfG family c-di-GMP phosphodiesterase
MSYNTHEEDLLLFAEEEGIELIEPSEMWKIIIVDDDIEIHHVTRMVMDGFEFDGKGLAFISAYTAREARNLLSEHKDIAFILLDVVMEEDDSGLQLVKFVRNELKNKSVRIALRTGQPGQAPEREVILEYDINDYKEKTDITSQKLFTMFVSALRAYRDITVIEKNKIGLEEIIKSSASLFELQSLGKFSSGVLTQLTSILNLHDNAVHVSSVSGLAATKGDKDIIIMAASGDYSKHINEWACDVIPIDVMREIELAFESKQSRYFDLHFVVYFKSNTGSENVIYLRGRKRLSEWDRYLIEIYCANVSVAFENIYLNAEMENTQKEIIFTMGEIAETRSQETGNHVKRVAEYSKLLALKMGLPEEDAELLRLASPMHDVGKVGIPDSVLNKPGKLSVEEFDLMKTHTTMGYSMLNHSQKKIIRTAATISLQHHEKYDGTGYPNRLKGEEIHIFSRITGIADVFDALCSDRVYKKAWPIEEVVSLIRSERGKHFDPVLTDVFLENLDELLEIKAAHADKPRSLGL